MTDHPTYVCPHCQHNVFDLGFTECTYGGTTTSLITFCVDEVTIAPALVMDFDEQWITCHHCNERINVDAMTLIDYYNNEYDEI